MEAVDLIRVGPEPEHSDLVIVAVHGRDQGADYLIEHLVDQIDRPTISWRLPQSARRQWYTGRAGDPIEDNEPELLASLDAIEESLAGLPVARTMVVGFSQGGCVVAELLARRPRRYAGAAILTGTLLGPEPERRAIAAPLDELPVLMALGSNDPWMRLDAATQTASALRSAGAVVDLVVTPSTDHAIHDADVRSLTRAIDLFIEGARS